MKVSNICAAAIVAVLGASLVGGTTAFADAKELEGKGTVTVDEGTITGTDPIPDPEKPEEPFTPTDPGDVTENPDSGSIIIQKVTNLNFDTISTSNKAIKKFAKPVAVTDGKRGAVVGWSDIRANETYGYTITASMSQQFTGTTATNKLTGATIQYKNGFFVAAADNSNVKPTMPGTTFTIGEDGTATTIMTATKAGKQGKGTYSLAYGDSRNATDDKSVELAVPLATASSMATDTYTAKVLWKIVPEV